MAEHLTKQAAQQVQVAAAQAAISLLEQVQQERLILAAVAAVAVRLHLLAAQAAEQVVQAL